MRLNFKKVSAIAVSALMAGMTMGTAVAANYPNPFVASGAADVAITYGTGSGVSSLDLVQAGNIQSNLQSFMSGTSTTTTSVTGEAAELFTGGTKIYISDTINKVRSVLTKSYLPTVLADGSFSGNVDATYTQVIETGAYPNITYEKQPTSSDEPNLAVKLSTNTDYQAFNLSVTFSKAVNFSAPESEGEDISLFGQDYTIGSATTASDLVLLQSAEKLDLSSDASTLDITIAGKEYTIELISASDTSATVKVTDKATGVSASKEVNEAQTKKIAGLTVAVTNADETNLKYSASIIAGSEKITFVSGSEVKVGEDDTALEGTHVDMHGGSPEALTKLTISVTTDDSDKDAIQTGGELLDPVFKTVKLSLGGFNIAEDATTRDEIKISNSGDDKMQITFTDYNGVAKTVGYAKFGGAGNNNDTLALDDDSHNISVRENERLHEGDYVVVGNEDEGHLLRLSNANNATTGYSDDRATFIDVFSGSTVETTWTNHGVGTIVVGGKSYDVVLQGDAGITDTAYNVTVNYPDSSGNNMILYPTMQTSKGAKVAFYEPLSLNITDWKDGATVLAGIMLPNGADAYQTLAITRTNATNVSVDCAGVAKRFDSSTDANTQKECNITSTGFGYELNLTNPDILSVRLKTVNGASVIETPAIMVFEEKDDNTMYEGLIVTTESGAASDDGIGVDDVDRTWGDDVGLSATSASDSKITKKIDLYGTLVTVDQTDSDQAIATISYPDEQVYALVYIGEETSSIGVTGGSAGGAQLGDVLVKDSEVSSVSSKNLIVIGGSCINSVAANVLGGAACSADFTTKTGIGSGQFLIQSLASPYASTKIVLLVSGYEAADTVNAATYLRTQTVDTTVGKKYQGTSATTATLVTTTA